MLMGELIAIGSSRKFSTCPGWAVCFAVSFGADLTGMRVSAAWIYRISQTD